MKYYLAGMDYTYKEIIDQYNFGIMISYAHDNQKKCLSKDWNINIILDSGAFSAWKRYKIININTYIKYCQKYYHKLDYCVMLDIITGSVEENLSNLNKMEDAGLKDKLLPVYHEGDNIKLLEEYISRNYTLIALGATTSRRTNKLQYWINTIFEYYPHNYHGLGMGNPDKRLHSADSSNWLKHIHNKDTKLNNIHKALKELQTLID